MEQFENGVALPWEDDEIEFVSDPRWRVIRSGIPGFYLYMIDGIASSVGVDSVQLIEWGMAKLRRYQLLQEWKNSGFRLKEEALVLRNFVDDKRASEKRTYLVKDTGGRYWEVDGYALVDMDMAEANGDTIDSVKLDLPDFSRADTPWESDGILLKEGVSVVKAAREGRYRIEREGVSVSADAARLLSEGYAETLESARKAKFEEEVKKHRNKTAVSEEDIACAFTEYLREKFAYAGTPVRRFDSLDELARWYELAKGGEQLRLRESDGILDAFEAGKAGFLRMMSEKSFDAEADDYENALLFPEYYEGQATAFRSQINLLLETANKGLDLNFDAASFCEEVEKLDGYKTLKECFQKDGIFKKSSFSSYKKLIERIVEPKHRSKVEKFRSLYSEKLDRLQGKNVRERFGARTEELIGSVRALVKTGEALVKKPCTKSMLQKYRLKKMFAALDFKALSEEVDQKEQEWKNLLSKYDAIVSVRNDPSVRILARMLESYFTVAQKLDEAKASYDVTKENAPRPKRHLFRFSRKPWSDHAISFTRGDVDIRRSDSKDVKFLELCGMSFALEEEGYYVDDEYYNKESLVYVGLAKKD